MATVHRACLLVELPVALPVAGRVPYLLERIERNLAELAHELRRAPPPSRRVRVLGVRRLGRRVRVELETVW